MTMRGAILVGLLASSVLAQQPPANGPRPVDPGWHALVHCDAVVRPGERIQDATIVIRDGLVVSVRVGGDVPAGARTWDCTGLTIYPGLVECHLPVTAPAPPADAPGAHWNERVTPQRSVLAGGGPAESDRESLRESGFAAAAIAPEGGIFRGLAAVVLLAEPDEDGPLPVVRERAYHQLGFRGGRGGYPNSQMGAIALMRQVLMDTDWYERRIATHAGHPDRHGPVPPSDALQALLDHRDLPLCFEATDELEILRAAKIAAEAGRPAVVVGNGMEFRRIEAIAGAGIPVVAPISFPEIPDVATQAAAERVDLRHLLSWEHAPSNIARLLDRGVEVAITTHRLENRKAFRENLEKAMAAGVTEDQALAALTTAPAELLGVGDDLGTIAPGRIANILVVDGSLFDPEAPIRQVWVGGEPYEVNAAEPVELEGAWSVSLSLGAGLRAAVEAEDGKLVFRFGEEEVKATEVALEGHQLDFLLAHDSLGEKGTYALHAHVEGDRLFGTGRTPAGATFSWSAQRDAAEAGSSDAATGGDVRPPALAGLPIPLGAYGMSEPVPQMDVWFTGATVWTAGPLGTIQNAVLFVQNGRVSYVGPIENAPEPVEGIPVVDVSGKHITPGLIDCHSHTGISRGVNESGQTITSEVRIQDVVDPDDINWYRQLAGGVTCANQLHGSANPIGGQNHVVKLRWGVQHPTEMSFDGARPGIKFALGENPRRVNSSQSSNRYPNSRLGVEAIIRDRFVAAREYAAEWQRYESLPPRERSAVMPPRRDLELEAVAEILAGERLIHCHSYRQDEIFMLCRLAREFGFKIGTFQHVLEGYKVAEAIKDAAIGASAFSDWWAFKLEVYDAIPEGGAIMHDVGVVVSFNSDSSELARRLNTEAGKAVKYGGLKPEEAIRFVTLNPAIQLGIQDRVGSLETGKDADFAIWSDDPLSYRAVCEATYIEGRPYFTRERDLELRAVAKRERQRLIQLALAAGASGQGKGRGKSPGAGLDAYWAAEDLTEAYTCCTHHGDH